MDMVQTAAERWRDLQPALDVEPMLVVGRMQRLWALWDARLRHTFADAALHPGDFDILAALRRSDAPTAPSDLARAVLVTAGATTKRVDRLVAAGFAERVAGSGDGRHRLVQLTPEGMHVADALMTTHLRAEAQLLAPLTHAEREQLKGLLAKLLAAGDNPDHQEHESRPKTA